MSIVRFSGIVTSTVLLGVRCVLLAQNAISAINMAALQGQNTFQTSIQYQCRHLNAYALLSVRIHHLQMTALQFCM